MIKNYFRKLYSGGELDSDTNIKSYLNDTELHVLDENDAISCEGLLTEDDCYKAVLSMQNNKAPGCDGLSSEFYKCFWPDIKDMLIESLNEGYTQGGLSESQRQLYFLQM